MVQTHLSAMTRSRLLLFERLRVFIPPMMGLPGHTLLKRTAGRLAETLLFRLVRKALAGVHMRASAREAPALRPGQFGSHNPRIRRCYVCLSHALQLYA